MSQDVFVLFDYRHRAGFMISKFGGEAGLEFLAPFFSQILVFPLNCAGKSVGSLHFQTGDRIIQVEHNFYRKKDRWRSYKEGLLSPSR